MNKLLAVLILLLPVSAYAEPMQQTSSTFAAVDNDRPDNTLVKVTLHSDISSSCEGGPYVLHLEWSAQWLRPEHASDVAITDLRMTSEDPWVESALMKAGIRYGIIHFNDAQPHEVTIPLTSPVKGELHYWYLSIYDKWSRQTAGLQFATCDIR